MAEQQFRQTAFKLDIKTVSSAEYVKEEGWQPNFLRIGTEKVARVNVIGVIVNKDMSQKIKSALLDDGTGSIELRVFDNSFPPVDVGSMVLVIGKPREFNGERYIVPEIVRKIDSKWFDVRKRELKELPEVTYEAVSTEEPVVEERVNISDDVLELIRSLDKGEGASIEEILESKPDSEKSIKRLLELGEIFEIKQGRFKVLE